MHKIAMLGTGLIGRFYTMSPQNFWGKDEIKVVCSNKSENAKKFAEEFGIPRWTDDLAAAIQDLEIDTVIVGIPNHLPRRDGPTRRNLRHRWHDLVESLAANRIRVIQCCRSGWILG